MILGIGGGASGGKGWRRGFGSKEQPSPVRAQQESLPQLQHLLMGMKLTLNSTPTNNPGSRPSSASPTRSSHRVRPAQLELTSKVSSHATVSLSSNHHLDEAKQKTFAPSEHDPALPINPPPPPRVEPSSNPTIMIHVYDNTDSTHQQFQCPTHILRQHIKYFASYFKNPQDQIFDIDIHCDAKVIAWILTFLQRSGESPPVLEDGLVIPVIMASEFLLVDTCLEHGLSELRVRFHQFILNPEMQDILEALLHLSAKSTKKLCRWAREVERDAFLGRALTSYLNSSTSKSRKIRRIVEKVLDRIHKYALVDLLFGTDNGDNAIGLSRCKGCGLVYASSLHPHIRCDSSRAKLCVNRVTGDLECRHLVDLDFNVDHFLLAQLRACNFDFIKLYWRIWSMCNALWCVDCHAWFLCAAYKSCYKHPSDNCASTSSSDAEPKTCGEFTNIKFEQGVGRFTCCNALYHPFDPFQFRTGCQKVAHRIVHTKGTACHLKGEFPVGQCKEQLWSMLMRLGDAFFIGSIASEDLGDEAPPLSVSNVMLFS